MERNTTGSFLLTSSSLTFIIFLSLFVPTLFFLSSSSSLSPSSSSAPALPTRFRRSASFVFAASASLSLSLFLIPSRRRCTEFWLPSFGYRVFQCVFHEKRKKTRICGDWPIACLPPFLEAVDHNWRVAVTHTHTHRHTRYANEAPVCKCDRDLPRPARARHLPACSFFFSFFLPSLDRKLGNQ